MVRLNTWLPAIGVLLLTCFIGCGWGGDGDDDFLAEFPEMAVSPKQQADNAALGGDPTRAESIQLNLKVGDRFPLIKTVQQTLAQPTGQGLVESTSKLEMLLTMTVEEVRDGSKRIGVRYQRVRYSRNLGGDLIEFDSSQPPEHPPMEVLAYLGMVENGFSFWVGADNRIVELAGFQDFLKSCLRDVPAVHRQQVLHTLASSAGDDGVANFVDDSIGLLPYDVEGNIGQTAVSVGDSWSRRRQVVQPIPMVLDERYMLRELADDIAQIDVLGTITPSTTFGPADQPGSGTAVSVRGGHCFGSCVIDRKTGIPIRSEIERYIDMSVTLADGQEFEQRKHILTTIRAFPQQSQAEVLEVSPGESRSGSTHSNPLAANPLGEHFQSGQPAERSITAASYGSETAKPASVAMPLGAPSGQSVANARYPDDGN